MVGRKVSASNELVLPEIILPEIILLEIPFDVMSLLLYVDHM